MGQVKFGKGAEDKPPVVTKEVRELKDTVQDLLSVLKKTESYAQDELNRAALLNAQEKKLEVELEKLRLELKTQTKLIKVTAGIIILVQILSMLGV